MAWIYLDDHFPEHPKIVLAGGDAGWLFVCILGYCRRHGTGGRVPKAAALRVSDRKNPTGLLKRMVEVELLVDDGDFYAVHNYDEWNRPQESRTEAARKAAKARWSKDRPQDASSNANASVSHDERISEPDASPCPMPLAPALPSTSSGESKVVRGSAALSLLHRSKHTTHGDELDGHIAALTALHGAEAVDRAVAVVADRLGGTTFAWPSDVRKALDLEVGPVEAPRPDWLVAADAQAQADRQNQAEGVEHVNAIINDPAVASDPEERRRILEAQRIARGAA